MTNPASRRPDDLHITARKLTFDYEDPMRRNRYWHNQDPVVTHFINALQATFPEGERFFIDAARDGETILLEKHAMEERLRQDLRLFIRQEALHGQQHRQWTQALILEGYEHMADYDDQMRRLRIWFRKHFSTRTRLSMTAAAEHYTASIAYVLCYVKPELLTESQPPFRDVLLYHAMEELEHKSVCYDLYRNLSGNYLGRLLGMLFVTFDLAIHVFVRHRYLLKRDGLWDRVHRRAVRRFFLGDQGLLKGIWPRIRSYLKPSFHPWQTDEREEFERMFGHLRSQAGIPPFQMDSGMNPA
jgi:predicted metal-dependent hydrolase